MHSIVIRKQYKQTQLAGQEPVQMKAIIIYFIMMKNKQNPAQKVLINV